MYAVSTQEMLRAFGLSFLDYFLPRSLLCYLHAEDKLADGWISQCDLIRDAMSLPCRPIPYRARYHTDGPTWTARMTDLEQRPLKDESLEPLEMDLSDEDILAAMASISGYLDITTEDFRALYHLAHQRAVARMFAHIRADRMMLRGIDALTPDLRLDEAARRMGHSGIMAMPATDPNGRVLGMLTETDFFRRLGVGSFLELILRLLQDPSGFTHRFHETTVREAMTSPAVTVAEDASFREIAAAFQHHEGRATPVVDSAGRLLGLLLRRDFIAACKVPGAM